MLNRSSECQAEAWQILKKHEPLLDDCRIVEFLGSGQMGCVFRVKIATPDVDKSAALLKAIPVNTHKARIERRIGSVQQRVDRLLTGLHGAQQVKAHANLVLWDDISVLAIGEQDIDGVYVLLRRQLMPYCLGFLLDMEVEIASKMAFAIVRGALLGLIHLHEQGVLHWNIKPENIFLDKTGNAMLGEFGITPQVMDAICARNNGNLTEYLAPEVLTNQKSDCYHRADLYSLGVVLYELLEKKLPYQEAGGVFAATDLTCSQDLDKSVVMLLKKVLTKDPADRFENGKALLAAIDLIMSTVEFKGTEKVNDKPKGNADGKTHTKKSAPKKPAGKKRISAKQAIIQSSDITNWRMRSESGANGAELRFATEPLTGMEFVAIPAGQFQMGSHFAQEGRDGDEGPVHPVEVDSFWLGRFPVTQQEWEIIMGNNRAKFKNGPLYPAEQVSYVDAEAFLNKFGEKHRTNNVRFRLPTEAEWEYACRAGTTTLFYFGDTLNSNTQANFNGTCSCGKSPKGIDRGCTTEVGIFPPNKFGLFDMHGNVREWCADCFDANFYAKPEATNRNPICRSNDCMARVLRGGSWVDNAWGLCSSDRSWNMPFNRYDMDGLRVVLVSED